MTAVHVTRSRRPRDKPVASAKRVRLSRRDLVWLEMLHRHGALPITYLHAFTRTDCTSLDAAKNRATVLFHEDKTPHAGRYLSRPFQQFATFEPMKNELVYDLAPAGERALREAGLWRENAPHTSSNHWRHDFMLSCVTGSIQLATGGAGLRFISQDEILDRAGAPLSFDVGYHLNGRSIELRPDRIFGIRYPSGKARLFILEADCSTETLASTTPRKTVERNARQYQAFIGGKRYRQALRTDAGILVLNATTSASRMTNMMSVWEAVHGGSCAYPLFTCLPQFSRYFKPPKVLTHLFSDPYKRVGHPPFQLNVE